MWVFAIQKWVNEKDKSTDFDNTTHYIRVNGIVLKLFGYGVEVITSTKGTSFGIFSKRIMLEFIFSSLEPIKYDENTVFKKRVF